MKRLLCLLCLAAGLNGAAGAASTNIGPLRLSGRTATLIAPVLARTLGNHLMTNLMVRTLNCATNPLLSREYLERYTGVGTSFYQYANRGIAYGCRWNTNGWLWGVKGLTATCAGFTKYGPGDACQNMFTMVSPRHFIWNSHITPNIFTSGQETAYFVDTNNVLYSVHCLGGVAISDTMVPTSDLDIYVGVIDQDLPPSVGFLPVLPANFTNWLTTTNYYASVGINQDYMSFACGVKLWLNGQQGLFDCTLPILTNQFTFGTLSMSTNWCIGDGWETIDGHGIVPGDSGDPQRFIIGNQFVLLGGYHIGGGEGPCIGLHTSAVNAAMAALSATYSVPTYTLTPFDLSAWPRIQ